ncbi:MAG: class IV adenylate cyclase [Candidatus Nanohaloarchaea archaeon]
MELENEVRYRVEDEEQVLKALNQRFKLKEEKQQTDTYFSPPHKDFSKDRVNYLRVRELERGESRLEYHEAVSETVTEETETVVSDVEALKRILDALDFVEDCVVRKNRRVFEDGELEIVLDRVENLGVFIEFEYQGESREELDRRVRQLAESIGVSEQDRLEDAGYPDLVLKEG